MKACTKCGEMKPLTEFTKNKHTRDGLNCWCKTCANEHTKRFRKTPSGIYTAIKGRSKFYKRKPFDLSRARFIEWYNAQPRVCVYCDIPEEHTYMLEHSYGTKTNRLTVDCRDNYSGYVEGNLALACYKCNSIKLDVFSFEEMREIAQKYLKPQWIKLVGERVK